MIPKPFGRFPAGYRNFDRPMVVVWEKMAKNPQKSRFFQISQKSSRRYLNIKYCFKSTLGHPRDSFPTIYHILSHPRQFGENPNFRRKINILAKITIFVIFTWLMNRPIIRPEHEKKMLPRCGNTFYESFQYFFVSWLSLYDIHTTILVIMKIGYFSL